MHNACSVTNELGDYLPESEADISTIYEEILAWGAKSALEKCSALASHWGAFSYDVNNLGRGRWLCRLFVWTTYPSSD